MVETNLCINGSLICFMTTGMPNSHMYLWQKEKRWAAKKWESIILSVTHIFLSSDVVASRLFMSEIRPINTNARADLSSSMSVAVFTGPKCSPYSIVTSLARASHWQVFLLCLRDTTSAGHEKCRIAVLSEGKACCTYIGVKKTFSFGG